MRTELDVVNACLATMGEIPLNSLSDPHTWRPAAQDKLRKVSERQQSKGYWFNRERITLSPNIVDSKVYLPGDTLKFTSTNPDLVMRGDKVFDLDGGTYIFTEDVEVTLIRDVPFEDLPHTAQVLIEAMTVFSFQSDYDADNSKREQLGRELQAAQADFNREETRHVRGNMIDANPTLARIKNVVRRIRTPVR